MHQKRKIANREVFNHMNGVSGLWDYGIFGGLSSISTIHLPRHPNTPDHLIPRVRVHYDIVLAGYAKAQLTLHRRVLFFHQWTHRIGWQYPTDLDATKFYVAPGNRALFDVPSQLEATELVHVLSLGTLPEQR